MARSKSNSAISGMAPDDRWRIQDDLRTLQQAAEIKADADRMKKAIRLHEQQARGMSQIAGVEKKASTVTHRQRLTGKRI